MTDNSGSRERFSPVTGMLLMTLFWGGNFTATKVAFEQLEPLAFTALRFAIGSAILWLVVRRVEGKVTLPPKSLWPLIILGVLGNTIYQILFVEGLARTSATKTALILAILPVAVTVGAAVFGIERVSRRRMIAVAVATVGVVLVLLGRGGTLGSGIRAGDLLLFGALVAWTSYTLLLRHWKLPMSAMSLTAWTIFTGTPGLVIAGIPSLLRTDWGAVSYAGWGGLAYSTLLSLVVAYILWNRGVAKLGASRAATFNAMVPFVATIIAMIGLGERPGLIHIVGGVLIIAGVILTREIGDRPGLRPRAG